MRSLVIALALLSAPVNAQLVPGPVDPTPQISAAVGAEAAARNTAIANATAGIVKSVQSIGPDGSGNVAGIATSTQLSTVMLAGDTIQVANPASGSTVTPAAGVTVLLLNNPTLLATLTVTMPASPTDGQRFVVSSAAGVTLLTLTGGTIKGGIASLSVTGYARFIYSANAGYWFRTG